jgi:hypothetical protein
MATVDNAFHFIDIGTRDALGEIVRNICKVRRLESKRHELNERIKDERDEIKGHWDNYIDGTKVFEEIEEFHLVRAELERMHILPVRKLVPIPPNSIPQPIPRPIGRNKYSNLNRPKRLQNKQ